MLGSAVISAVIYIYKSVVGTECKKENAGSMRYKVLEKRVRVGRKEIEGWDLRTCGTEGL